MKKLFICLVIFLVSTNSFASEKKQSLTAFYGIGTNGNIGEMPTFTFEIKKAYFAGLAYSYEFYRTNEYKGLSLEAEVAGYDHFGDFGNHKEGTITLLARFNDLFPKNWWLESFAAGEGLSYASVDPPFESYLHNHNKANDLLNYLAFEFVFRIPKNDNIKFIYRIHHRSGVWGLYDGIRGGSNYLSFGLRYKF